MLYQTISKIEDTATMLEVMARKINGNGGMISKDDMKRVGKFLSSASELLRFLIDNEKLVDPQHPE